MNLAQIIFASTVLTGSGSITFPSPGSYSPPNTNGTSPGAQGGGYIDPGGYAASVPAPATSGFIRRGYSGYWANQGSYNDDNPTVFNGTVLDSQADSYVAFGYQDNSDTFCMEWKGYFQPNASGTWNFQASADDVLMFWIGNAALSPNNGNWTCNSGTNNGLNSQSPTLVQDQWYPIRFRFQEWGGAETCGIFAAPTGSEMIALYQYGWMRTGFRTDTTGY